MQALIVVDLQNDFMDDGALPVAGAYELIPVANAMMERFPIVVATQDWHPADHGSFASNHPGKSVFEHILLDGLPQVLWPTHCVEDGRGADFVESLQTERFTRVFRKGTDPSIDSYSGFWDNGHRRSTGLGEWLRDQGVTGVFVLGVATDFCVKFTALDAAREGFSTVLVVDGCAGVNQSPGDVDVALGEMVEAGVTLMDSRQILGEG